MLNQYRISKYDPSNRVGYMYIVDEWTDYSDIGKVYNGFAFTLEEYEKTENSYINCIIQIMQLSNIRRLNIKDREVYNDNNHINSMSAISIHEVKPVIRECLRNSIWCKLEAKNFFVHFGYDFYIYIGCVLSKAYVESIVVKNGLFCELFQSPYI